MTTQSRIVDWEEEKESIQAERFDLEAAKLGLLADRAEFNDEKRQWKKSKDGSYVKTSSETANANKLEADRLQLEAEKTQFRLAQIQLKAAQSQLEDGRLNLESAQTRLEEAREQLEIARRHLEAAKTQTDIINTRLAAAKSNLNAAKMRFDVATKQLNDAKSKFEDAKTQLEAAKSRVGTSSCASLEEENVKLRNEVSQLQSEISKGQNTIRGLENDKVKLEAEASKGKVEITRLSTENCELKNDKLRVEDEIKETRTELEQVKKENNLLQEKYKILERMKSGNPKVFFDMTIRGIPTGRIVFELFADNTPDKVEIFRALCTGEKGVSQTGKPLHYKGTSINYVHYNYWLAGGDIIKGNVNEAELIYGDMKPAGENLFNKYTGPGDLCMFLDLESYPLHSFGICPLRDNTNLVRYVTIGKVIQGMDVVSVIHEAFPNYCGMLPSESQVVIANSGQLS